MSNIRRVGPTDQRKNPDKHWQEVKDHCKYEASLEPECINAQYGALDHENALEWGITID